MSEAFVDVSDGKFEIWVRDPWWDREPDIRTADPKEAVDRMIEQGATSLSQSSSLDFPDEYGMDHTTIEAFYAALNEE